MLRVTQNNLRGTGFHHRAFVHHDQLLGPLSGQRQVVGYQQHGGAQFTGELLQVIKDLALHRDIQRRGRLVGDQ